MNEIEVGSVDLDGRKRWGNSPLPDFITSASLELIPSAAFFAFFGAIVALY
jgi:hypothetical protein